MFTGNVGCQFKDWFSARFIKPLAQTTIKLAPPLLGDTKDAILSFKIQQPKDTLRMHLSQFESERFFRASTSTIKSSRTIPNTALMLLASVFGLVSMSGCTTTATYWDENAIR